MTDYRRSTGSSGTMLIRDNGTTVSFMINSNNGTTFANQLPWGYTVNGVTNNSRESRYSAGAGWVTLGSWTVTTDQTVTFRLFSTGTSGFGGPTTFSVTIDRASAPATPSKPVISQVTGTSMRVIWIPGANNGSSIDLTQVARNTANNVGTATIINADTDNIFTGLARGTTYYWWARTHNAKGYSPWSAVASAKTLDVPVAPDQPITSDATQTSFVVSFADNDNGGSPVVARAIYYNTTKSPAEATVRTYTGVMTITDLDPATTYYVWGRVQNAAGWSAASPIATIRTVAGAWFNVGNVWKEAIPYVNVGGIWKLARPWSKASGVWKETL